MGVLGGGKGGKIALNPVQVGASERREADAKRAKLRTSAAVGGNGCVELVNERPSVAAARGEGEAQ